ncbi:MAG: geranylgeranylglyceryl/heptaprenylglyceryl phosphate synthase [Candidatus Zixiibacteriota bacterium]|nr:MAG: geranylgeranylglyceryl/heptaprenylglyceryl phosphate synthase [candidate division Zixibacteria bacterium]
MNTGSVYNHLLQVRESRGGGFMILVDPDKGHENDYLATCERAEDCGVDAILVGSSFMLNSNFAGAVGKIKQATSLPVIIFPGSFAQITPDADAILFSSLISGRNPAFLIDEQVKGAPLVKKYNLEAIPTGYMLIESGSLTSVQYISGSMPIPRGKSDIACAHAMAAQYLGMRLVYLEAGSGAGRPVPLEMVRSVSSYVDIPLIVGGGLRTAQDCRDCVEAGASFVVVGNHLEADRDFSLLRQLAAATHDKDSVKV